MTTRIADVIVPEVFNPYTVQHTNELSALYQSGIVAPVAELKNSLGKGNRYFNMPFWNDLGGDDESLEDTSGWALTPDKITSNQDMATQLFRGKAWSATDLSRTLSGDDPMKAIGDLVAGYWNRRMQAALISTLKGSFTTITDTHVNDISGGTGDAAKISGPSIVDTMSKLGDAHEVLTGLVMHSVPYFNLVKQGLLEDVRDANGNVLYKAYLGKRIIIDDGVPTETSDGVTKYTTYLFGAGAIGYAEGSPEVPTETDRDKLAGEDILINRKHFVLHPRGIKFTNATVAKTAPTNAELELAANWGKVYEDKDIRMVALITLG
ncbi:major capsid protein [Lysinibacillus sphaericus]|uniref:Prophage LambdaCh01, coat protein n=1 Tax=Lysinibacillus sphaericus OT4b.31 TaxID=1285586 RepID=R7ZDN0_LYSSH|nr:major capsid protein [Lysinibacillus sphaericus]EON72247.1 prophage LambdaCh01, coat protein [Lysinibacillus sphaericus OT4b.31]